MLLSLPILIFTALGAIASPVTSPKTLHSKRIASPSWNAHRRLEPHHTLPLKIGLTQSNIDSLPSLLSSVSDPLSPTYGQHYTPSEIASIFAPSDESIGAVKSWLHSEGIHPSRIRLSDTKAFLSFEASVEEAERLLETEYHIFKHEDGSENVGCHEFSVPEHLVPHIDLITPTINVARMTTRQPEALKKRGIFTPASASSLMLLPKTNGELANADAVSPTSTATCDQFITPACLRALYQITRKPTETKRNTLGVVELTPQSFLQGDLDLFFRNFSPSTMGEKPILVSIDGGVPSLNATAGFNINGESDLDLQVTMSLTSPQPVQLYQTGDNIEGGSFNNYLDALDGTFCTFEGGDNPNFDGIYPDPAPGGFKGPESCGIVKPANVISVSYSGDESTFPASYQQRECAEFGKLGMMGVSVLYSSGDSGVGGRNGRCLTANGTESVNGTRFSPMFPLGCPFVTAVGATQVNPNATVHDPESACMQVIFSGGGFSNVFEIPSYQEKAVNNWFREFPPPFTSAQFNNTRKARAYPDISANGANYVIAVDGSFFLVFGTSASTPTFASILTLINDARLSIGKRPVGFINPVLYSDLFEGAFHDVTSGTNPGCGTPGFSAVKGWDPVTGLGTPNFDEMVARWLILP
ncbi:subtilisin-like protein [Sistotremastrum niveocremeum HHB9708]|uniref:tripeptidyl-peptidase II n=1 Tax=Sistotremastrum niveocremeum HHB9708 TaxID=1314777 RepID=A0A164ST62_9AGAM|nr:subtilisin-like protein [Sistotremastrum niveocremeum HHB9708]